MKNDLTLRFTEDTDQHMSCCLRLVGDDRHLFGQQLVHQRRFAGVGSPREGYDAAFCAHRPSPPLVSGVPVICARTRVIRRS